MKLGIFGLSAPRNIDPGKTLEWTIGEAARLKVQVIGAEGRATLHWGSYSVDLDHWRELRLFAADRGVEIEPYVRAPFDLIGRGAAKARAATIESIRASRELGGPVLRTGYGDQTLARTRFAAKPLAEHLKVMESNLREAAQLAESEGVVLAIENHTDFTGREWAEVFAHVGSKHVRCALDTGNGMTIFSDPLEDADALAPWTVTTHVKDLKVIENPRPAKGPSPRVPFGLVGCPIGQGDVNVEQIVRKLFAVSPPGSEVPLIVEPSWPVVARGENIFIKRNELLRANLRNLRKILSRI